MADERRNTLALLAKSANRSHRWAVASAGAAMRHVVAAGHAPVQARELCEEGGWLRWLRKNFEGSVRTAQRYMRVARHLPASGIDATRVSHRSQTALLRGVVFTEPCAAAWYLPSEQKLNAVLPASSSILDDFAHASPTLRLLFHVNVRSVTGPKERSAGGRADRATCAGCSNKAPACPPDSWPPRSARRRGDARPRP